MLANIVFEFFTKGGPVMWPILACALVAVAVVALMNAALGLLPHWGDSAITLQRIFALPFRPVLWLMGVPWAETPAASALMATKTVLNEFVAYLNFSQLPGETFSPRSRMILTYALCGFANFGSLGIVIGGLGAMVPARRAEIVSLGLRTILSGTLATCMSGAVAGALAVIYSANLEATEQSVRAAGAVVTRPIFSFPGGRRFHFIDPSGNELAVWSDGV